MEIGVRERELKIISVSKNFCNFLPRITFSFWMQNYLNSVWSTDLKKNQNKNSFFANCS